MIPSTSLISWKLNNNPTGTSNSFSSRTPRARNRRFLCNLFGPRADHRRYTEPRPWSVARGHLRFASQERRFAVRQSRNHVQRTTDNGPLTPRASREQRKPHPKNATNEPKLHEIMTIVIIQAPVEVTSDPGVKSGLDSILIKHRQRDSPRGCLRTMSSRSSPAHPYFRPALRTGLPFVTFVTFCSNLICTTQDEPFESVDQLDLQVLE